MRTTYKFSPFASALRVRGLTLIEVMVALAISLAFLSGLLAAFVQISQTAERIEVRQEAVSRARAAIDTISIDVKQARMNPNFPIQLFIGTNSGFGYGNGKDDDFDGQVDEDSINGLDDDGDWNNASDRHVVVNGTAERPNYILAPDLGDLSVDEDPRFGNDALQFRIYPDPSVPNSRDEIVRYELGTYDGEDNALIRTLVRNPGAGNEESWREPLAFQVMGLDFLYWNPNVLGVSKPYWTSTWDASTVFTQPDPRLEFPVSVYISITVYADTRPFEHYKPSEEIDTITLGTVVNIEQVLKDGRWQRIE